MDTEQKNKILEECRDTMSKAKYDEAKTEQFCDTVSDILQYIIDNPDEEREIKYKIIKHIDSVELRLDISGDKIDPMTDGEGAEKRQIQSKVNSLLFNPETSVSSYYTKGWNHLAVKSASKIANSKLLSEPMVKGMLLGILAGIIVRFLPDTVSTVILEKIATPIMNAFVSLMMGFMGPVFFVFIIVAVSSLGSLEELSKVGKVILKRFVVISLWMALLTTAVAALFFHVLGSGNAKIGFASVLNVLIDILPKNLITPFIDGNIPQVILLGLVFGTALLMIGDSGKEVTEWISRIKIWMLGVMAILMKALPLLPFLSTMLIVANGDIKIFLQGWKFIAAVYICYILSLVIEFIAVSVKCHKSIADLFKMLKDMAVMAFVTAVPQATIQSSYEVSARDMHIDSTFTNVWISLSMNLLSPARTIELVLAAFFMAELTGVKIGVAMLIVMLITVIQLSLASTGTTASATVLLKTLKMSTDDVGVFSAFEIFTRNASAAYDVMYCMLEQYDAARETGNINSAEETEEVDTTAQSDSSEEGGTSEQSDTTEETAGQESAEQQ